jgi:hypothetical protein
MPKITRTGSTLQQAAYAKRVFGAQGRTKQQIALDCGYSRHVAATPKSKIESTKGYQNAVARLAADSNNLALTVMSELKARGFTDFSNKDLVGALNAISSAWKAFNTDHTRKESQPTEGQNRLRTVILQRIENQTMNSQPSVPAIASTPELTPEEKEVINEVDPNLDF